MAIARFTDLCIDAVDQAVTANFWSKVLGQGIDVREDGAVHLHGPAFVRTWVNAVPESKTVKNRVHLDLEVHDVGVLESLGATTLSRSDDWAVLADPEGNELCASPGEDLGVPGLVFALCVDCERPVELAAWWHGVLGGQLVPAPDGTPRWLLGAAGLGPLAWKFIPVPEPKTVKNRVHWDVEGEVDELVAAGAEVVRPQDTDVTWTVMADPEGNEFCVFAPR